MHHLPSPGDWGYYAQTHHPRADPSDRPRRQPIPELPFPDCDIMDIPPARFDYALEYLTEPGTLVLTGVGIDVPHGLDYLVSMQWADEDPLGQYGLISMLLRTSRAQPLPECLLMVREDGPQAPERRLCAAVTFSVADRSPAAFPGVLLRLVLAHASQMRKSILLKAMDPPGQSGARRLFSLKWWNDGQDHVIGLCVEGTAISVVLLD